MLPPFVPAEEKLLAPLKSILPPVADAPFKVTIVFGSPAPGGNTGLFAGMGLALAPAIIKTLPPLLFTLDPGWNVTLLLLNNAKDVPKLIGPLTVIGPPKL